MILEGLSFDEYLAKPGLSRSDLLLFRRGPNYYKFFKSKKPSKAMNMGTLVHKAILEPDAPLNYSVKPSGLNLNSKEGREWKANANGILLSEEEEINFKMMVASFRSHPTCGEYIKDSINEASVLFDYLGMPCKCRPDIIQGNVVVDLKTTRHMIPRKLGYDFVDMGYDLQSAFYSIGVSSSLKQEVDKFVIIWLLNTPPFDIRINVIETKDLYRHQDALSRLMLEFQNCVVTDHWPTRQPLEAVPLETAFVDVEYPEEEVIY